MIGTTLKIRYEITHEIYDHPLFLCYGGRDRVSNNDVCIRLLKSDIHLDGTFISELYRWVHTFQNQNFLGIETIYDIGEYEDYVFIITSPMSQQVLSDLIQKLAPFSPQYVFDLLMQIVQGLRSLNLRGEVHGELIPLNMGVISNTKISLLMHGFWKTYLMSPLIIDKLAVIRAPYRAPELYEEGNTPNFQTDIYSLGCVLFELLTGRPPYLGENVTSIVEKHNTAPIPSIRVFNPSVPIIFEELIKNMLCKTPQDRYENLDAFIKDVTKVQEVTKMGKTASILRNSGNTVSEPLSKKEPVKRIAVPQKQIKRRLDMIKLFYAGLLGVGMMGGFLFFFSRSAPKQVKVPSLLGMTPEQAQKVLQETKLVLNIESKVSSEKYPEGVLVEVQPMPGMMAKEGSTLSGTISSGIINVLAPSLVGKNIEEAKSIVAPLGIRLQEMNLRENSKEESGTILSQIPEAGISLQKENTIVVKVSAGSLNTSEEENKLVRRLYRIQFKLPEMPQDVIVRVDMVDNGGVRTVYEKLHLKEDKVELETYGIGRNVHFKLYIDGELKKELTK